MVGLEGFWGAPLASAGMDFSLPPEVIRLGLEATAVAERGARRHESLEDAWIIADDAEFAQELGRLGYLGMTWPRESGGYGRSALERFVVSEALLRAGAPVASCWFADRQIGPVLLQYGTPEQRNRYLPGILAGTARWCIGMSEPDAGSNVAGIATTAVRDGNEFVINGQKIWTSGAQRAEWCYLICRTDPEAPAHKGLSEFILPMDTQGISVRPIQDASGASHFCELFLADVRIPADNLVGELNNSFGQTMRQLEHERGGIDRLFSNRTLLDLVEPLVDTQDDRRRQQLARIQTRYAIGRLMVLHNVMGQAPRGYSALTKIFCSEFEQEVANFCASVAGADAMLGNRVSRGAIYAPAYTLMGGTTQILRNIVGERTLGLPREPRKA